MKNVSNWFSSLEYNSAGNLETAVHFETTLDGDQVLEIQSSINITCYQDSFIVMKEYSSSEAVEKIEKRLMIL